MLVEGLFTVVKWLLNAILNLLDVLPDFPASLVSSLNSFFDLVFDNLSLIGFFIPLTTVKILVPLLIVVINFEYIYAFIMWILRKIPFIDVK